MRRWIGSWVAVLLLAGGATAGEQIEWAKSWDEARKAAESSNKLIVVDFFTDWCGWCKRLDANTYTDAGVIKLSRDFVNLKVNAEKEGVELAKKYGVNGYPTILVLDKTGEVVGRIGGYMPPEPFAKTIAQIRDAHTELPKLQARLKDAPDDGPANARYAEIMAMRDKRSEAETAIARAEKAGFTGDSLARACNAVGDQYQNERNLARAAELFRKADAAAKDPEIRAYAKVSLLSCLDGLGRQEDARAVARELIALKGAPQDLVEYARQYLERG